MEGDEIELIDAETMGVKVDGLSVNQIRKLKNYYQQQTGDMDLNLLNAYSKGN